MQVATVEVQPGEDDLSKEAPKLHEGDSVLGIGRGASDVGESALIRAICVDEHDAGRIDLGDKLLDGISDAGTLRRVR